MSIADCDDPGCAATPRVSRSNELIYAKGVRQSRDRHGTLRDIGPSLRRRRANQLCCRFVKERFCGRIEPGYDGLKKLGPIFLKHGDMVPSGLIYNRNLVSVY
jgi:hypothetical protein